MVNVLVALVLFAHGVGHSMGVLQVFHVAAVNPQWKGDSWLLSGPLGTSFAQNVGAAIWLAAMVGFVATAAVLLGWLPQGWWAPLAVGSSILSLLGLVLFPTAFPIFSTIGALAVDAVVIVGVVALHWLPGTFTA
jgi:hypothetical protein